jgi:hypothetical protein
VYRISLGNFIFFGAMACALVGVKRRSGAFTRTFTTRRSVSTGSSIGLSSIAWVPFN